MRNRPRSLSRRCAKNEFDFEMYLDSMSQMKKMGGLSSVMGMMPGMGIGGGKMPDIDTDEARKGHGPHRGNHLFHDTGGKTKSKAS